ncbi:MAG: ABC transporter ATP-binding protein [Geminicoccaceae bacterium]
MSLLDVSDLKVHFGTQRRLFAAQRDPIRAVDGVSFSLGPRETLSIVGESGCGKSTLGNAVLGFVGATSGRIALESKDVASFDHPILNDIQVIFQDPSSALNPRMRIGASIEEPLRARGVDRATRRAKAMSLLKLVGFPPEFYSRFPNQLSGGQRQRVVIARALSVEPKVIVCDEPVSALDVSIRAQILNLLVDLQARLGVSYIFISHDMASVRFMSDRVAVMYLGRIVEEGPGKVVLDNPQHPYTKALLSAVLLPDPELQRTREKIVLQGELPSQAGERVGCSFAGRCPLRGEECLKIDPQLRPFGDGRQVACLRV